MNGWSEKANNPGNELGYHNELSTTVALNMAVLGKSQADSSEGDTGDSLLLTRINVNPNMD